MAQTRDCFTISNRSAEPDATPNDGTFEDDEPLEESQNTQTQMECTQLTQPGLTPDESSNIMPNLSLNHTPLSPPPIIPFGRLVPCVPSAELTAKDLMPTQESYWLGRSHKCDVTANYPSDIDKKLSKTELASLEWGKSMISNRHCRIFQQKNGNQIFIEDNSGNGTFINQQTHLRKGETRILHSGDEICLINTEILRKKISSYRVIQMVLQQFSFIFVQSKPRKSCVNPRAMNYHFGRNHFSAGKSKGPKSSVLDAPSTRRIEAFYDMREVLGDGTSGQVRRAIHRQSGEERAVKVISLRRHVDVSIMEREVEVLKSLDHPYIVKLVEVFVQHGVALYLVMELVKGGDLFDSIVEKQRYTAVEARRTMRRLLSAVHYLHHESNIVHRDLKPENILCSSPTHVKLADFGLAKIVKADGLKTFCGTPAYFAPEVLQRRHTVSGQGRYGKPADMWSLGVILYILLTGKPPFDPDMEETSKPFELDFESDAEIWSRIPHAKDLVEKLLCLNPQRRLTVRQACDHLWINVDDGDTHCDPLDDPAIGTKKSMFGPKSEASDPDDVVADANTSGKNDLNKTDLSCSKKCSALFEGEIRSAISAQYRSDDVFRVDALKLLEPEKVVVDTVPLTINTTTSKGPILDCGEEKRIGANVDAKNAKDGEKEYAKNQRFSDASSSDSSHSASRSPLSKLNFNQRSNDFRNQVLKAKDSCQSLMKRTERFESPNANGQRHVAIIPSSTNIKTASKQPATNSVDDDKKIEDPILSQFSSSASSVESFSDSSVNESLKSDQLCPVPNSNKRLPEKEISKNIKPSKRTKTCSSKQTTLNSWLVKKG